MFVYTNETGYLKTNVKVESFVYCRKNYSVMTNTSEMGALKVLKVCPSILFVTGRKGWD